MSATTPAAASSFGSADCRYEICDLSALDPLAEIRVGEEGGTAAAVIGPALGSFEQMIGWLPDGRAAGSVTNGPCSVEAPARAYAVDFDGTAEHLPAVEGRLIFDSSASG